MEVGTTQPRLAAILALGGTRWAGVPFGRRPARPRGGLGRDRDPRPSAAPLPARPVAGRAERTQVGARFAAYAHPIQETVKGGPVLFIRGDEAEEAWPIIDAVMKAWSPGDVSLQDDAAGGPRRGTPL